ncbi:MAG: DNA double-strand break repair nuclease NurA [Caldilineaceae bacterium]|nr:DNA double-strand break repair nuclease NurA [Caldilineaceae bacterium]
MGMLSRNKVIDALENKRAKFEEYQAEQRSEFDLRQQLLERFLQMSAAEVGARVAERGQAWPGALPTSELDEANALCVSCTERWQHHQEARAWALTVLQGRPVAAVDGSQIPPSKELSTPLGAVQIGWYINYHVPGGRYEKDVRFEVLAPQELGEEEGGEFPDWRVNQQRFVGECKQLMALMERFAAPGAGEAPLCFFDGSFIISFVGQIRPNRAEAYLDAVRTLLDTSARLAVPLVGFVDSSGSRDVVMLINTVAGPPYMSLTDGALFAPLLPNWGDRTPFFICARNDPLSQQGNAEFYQNVAFCYIRLAAERPPARIELPRWLVEAGLAGAIVDRVRAECIVGAGGYPYAIETADAVAVLKQADRDHFYALFQQFAEQQGLQFHFSRKQLSKQARR